MEITSAFFENFENPELVDSSLNFNIGCIQVLEYDHEIKLVPEPSFTHLKHIMTIGRNGNISFSKSKQINPKYKKKGAFSLFVGFLSTIETSFVLFVKTVKRVRVEAHLVFQVQSLSALNLESFQPDDDLSKALTTVFNGVSLFSYTMDLSNGDSYVHLLESKVRALNPNFFFVNNLNAIEFSLVSADRGWFVPIIFGQVSKIMIDRSTLYTIYKESLLDCNPVIQEDVNLLSNFFCPTSMRVADLLLFQNERLTCHIRVLINNFPGIITKSERKANNYFGLNYNANRVYRYFQFINEFFRCSQFILSGSKELLDVMRRVNKFDKLNLSQREILKIKHIDEVQAEDDPQILAKVASLIDAFRTEFSVDYSPDPIFFTLSICTENKFRHMSALFEMIVKLFFLNSDKCSDKMARLNLLPAESKKAAELIKIMHAFFANVNDMVILRSDVAVKISMRKHKKLSSFQNFGAVLKEYHGPRKLLSNTFDKLINQKKLDVFNYHKIQLSIVTHNCSGEVPESLGDLGYANNSEILKSDLIVICLQEIIEMKSKNFRNIVYTNNAEADLAWTQTIKKFFPNFHCVGKSSLLGLMMIILINRRCKAFLELALTKHKSDKLGFMKLLANKGSIFLDLKVNYEKLTVTNCHLEAGNAEKVFNVRIEQLKNIVTFYNTKKIENLGFIAGDMNFRLYMNPFEAEKLIETFLNTDSNTEREEALKKLLEQEKLTQFMKNEHNCLSDFFEYPINFLPSYKKEPGVGDYLFDKQVPSW